MGSLPPRDTGRMLPRPKKRVKQKERADVLQGGTPGGKALARTGREPFQYLEEEPSGGEASPPMAIPFRGTAVRPPGTSKML